MKKYKLISETQVQEQTTKACIPFAEGNRDYEAYKQWLAEGNTPDPMDDVAVVSNGQSEVALKEEIKTNIQRGEFAEAITKMAKLVGIE